VTGPTRVYYVLRAYGIYLSKIIDGQQIGETITAGEKSDVYILHSLVDFRRYAYRFFFHFTRSRHNNMYPTYKSHDYNIIIKVQHKISAGVACDEFPVVDTHTPVIYYMVTIIIDIIRARDVDENENLRRKTNIFFVRISIL